MFSEASLLSGPFPCRMATAAHTGEHKGIYCLTRLHRDDSLLHSCFFSSYTMSQSFAYRMEPQLYLWPGCVLLEGDSWSLMDIQAVDKLCVK